MFGIFLILLLTIYMAFLFPIFKKKPAEEPTSEKYDQQMKKLWTIAQSSMREKKTVRAEKALLTILKFDEKNAAAYNRLGILYAKGQKYEEAIECFEIAQSLDNNASSLHNAGLIYLETGAYEKASIAFRQAIELEGDVPARFIALAKSEEKIGNRKNAIEALESAYELDHSTSTLRQILAIYEAAEDTEAITATTARIEQQLAEDAELKKKKTRRSMLSRTAQTAANSAVTKVSKPAEKPTTKPAAKPVTKPAAKPVAKPLIRRPLAKPTTKAPATKPQAAVSTAQPARKPVRRIRRKIQ